MLLPNSRLAVGGTTPLGKATSGSEGPRPAPVPVKAECVANGSLRFASLLRHATFLRVPVRAADVPPHAIAETSRPSGGVGRFRKTRSRPSMDPCGEPLAMRSIRAVEENHVEAKYRCRATRTPCEGNSIVENRVRSPADPHSKHSANWSVMVVLMRPASASRRFQCAARTPRVHARQLP